MSNVATERQSSLAVKLELLVLTGTLTSSGTTVTMSDSSELVVGGAFGNNTKGYRRVISITDGTTVEVNSAFISVLASDTCYKQNYGIDPTIASGDVIEFVPPFTLEPTREEIKREVVNRSFDEVEPVLGSERVAGDIGVELHGSGSAGTASEADPLWQCAIGERDASSASTTIAASTTTLIKLDTGEGVNHKVGQHIMLDPTSGGTGAYEASRITNISTDDLTVSPAFSEAPPVGRAITAGIHYKPTLTELHSLWAQFWRGDITLETYEGNKCSQLAIDFQSGQTINPVFSFMGQETAEPVSQAYALGTPSYDSGEVHVARYMVVKIGGVLYPVSATNVTLVNTIFERTDVTKFGLHSLIRTAREITGSFELLYENKDVDAAFRAGTTAELFILSSHGATSAPVIGNTFVLSFPKIRYTAVPKNAESGLYKYAVTFRAVRTLGEDSMFASFL